VTAVPYCIILHRIILRALVSQATPAEQVRRDVGRDETADRQLAPEQRPGGTAPVAVPDAGDGVAPAGAHQLPGAAHRPAEGQRQLQVLAGVRVDRTGPAVHVGPLEHGREQAEEPVRERDRVRPLAGGAATAAGRAAGQRLHKRQLLRRLPQAQRVRGHAGPAAGDGRRLLAHVLGGAHVHHRHDDQAGGAHPGQVRPVLAGARLANVRPGNGGAGQRPGAGHVRGPIVPPDPHRRGGDARGEAAAVRRVARSRRSRSPGAAAAVHEARAGRQPGRFRPGGGALQRGRGPHRLFHRHRRHAGTGQERAQRRHLRARHVPQGPAQLHGPGMARHYFGRRGSDVGAFYFQCTSMRFRPSPRRSFG